MLILRREHTGFRRVGFLVGVTGQNLLPTLVLRFSAITGESKSETRCPAQFTRGVNPRTPTSDTRGKP